VSSAPTEEKRCPVCGRGLLRHLGTEAGRRKQRPESPILETYTCGHEVREDLLETADADRLEVERRSSGETATEGEDRA
jgi:hypothetical protein